MTTVRVNLGKRSYDIIIKKGLFKHLGRELRARSKATKIIVVTDQNVERLYGKQLKTLLVAAGFTPLVVAIEPGETSKNLAVLGNLYEKMAAFGLTRSDLLVTFGGGVVGDLGGFAAATFLRGIQLVQVPTSLLAQIDSSVGGKVAVDLTSGKNLVGSFYQPQAVLIDPELLKTLPVRFLHDGLAEAIKYGCIADESLFAMLEDTPNDAVLVANSDALIASCCKIKARIVERDEFDTGERMLLNFGHTIGHAIEKCTGYESYTHGEAVAIGMVRLTARTEALGLTAAGTTARLQALLLKFDLPLQAETPNEQLLAAMLLDKKKNGDELTLVILEKIGASFLQKVPFAALTEYMG
ncbi:MAG TPA: 3-dehydroquinate synthase [Candidatus Avacidaminococcus intestinavium]|uniref:3-dehydroquinate synthase n=1 Tax=Candidatus Avacidaminococcus intestinavium TaxID=2840684 RepID=A0A9D1SLK1_9FIRM|nr:3-dehydroquinate synthase [Candidatus Avacidaminococcus intestinavium]